MGFFDKLMKKVGFMKVDDITVPPKLTGLEGFLIEVEGLNPSGYKDLGGVMTIGVGHVVLPNDPVLKRLGIEVTDHMYLTHQQCLDVLREDIQKAEYYLDRGLKVEVTQNEYDALISLIFNIGGTAFTKSTLLKVLNGGEKKNKVAEHFLHWKYVKSKPVSGLLYRRVAEATIFLGLDDVPDFLNISSKALPTARHRLNIYYGDK